MNTGVHPIAIKFFLFQYKLPLSQTEIQIRLSFFGLPILLTRYSGKDNIWHIFNFGVLADGIYRCVYIKNMPQLRAGRVHHCNMSRESRFIKRSREWLLDRICLNSR